MNILAHAPLTTIVLVAGAISLTPFQTAGDHERGSAGHETVTLVMQQALANIPGKTLSAAVVTYAPGQASLAHRHAGSVFAYVLSGEIRSQNSATGAARVYKAGESFFEPPGSEHLISENARKTQPASLLAVFDADDGAVLTTPNK